MNSGVGVIGYKINENVQLDTYLPGVVRIDADLPEALLS